MDVNPGRIYDPETIELLRTVLDDAWACVLPAQQASFGKTLLAERLLGPPRGANATPDSYAPAFSSPSFHHQC
jgi:hypothetical protein